MTVGDLLEHSRKALLGAVLCALLGPPLVLLLRPSVYYVERPGVIRIYGNGLREPLDLPCPRFQVSASDITLAGYFGSHNPETQGLFVHVPARGVQAVGPVTIRTAPQPGEASAIVHLHSKPHPLVPSAFIHMADSEVRRLVPARGRELLVVARWKGSVDATHPPLTAVECDGKPMSRRFTALGVF